MPINPNIDFSDAKQDRSKRTLDDLLEAAYAIVESADPAEFTSRALASKSGYSLGTLSKRLGSIENIFFWAIQKGREAKFNSLAKAMAEVDPQVTVQDFVQTFIDKSFSGINVVTPKVMRYYDDRFTRKYGLSADYFGYVDVLVEPYLEVCNKDQTNSFRKITRDEARFIFKAILALVERPFVNGDPIAGTSEHRRIAIDAITGLLAKQSRA